MADNRQIEDWQGQALLTEYQACQNDVNSESANYWSMARIFYGISTALLVALIFWVVANPEVFTTFVAVLSKGRYATLKGESSLLSIKLLNLIILLASVVTISISHFLRGWLNRVSFLQQINFRRMRDIELELGMWKSWRFTLSTKHIKIKYVS